MASLAVLESGSRLVRREKLMEGGHCGRVEVSVMEAGRVFIFTFSSVGSGLEVEETLLADLLTSQLVSIRLSGQTSPNLLQRGGGRCSAAGHARVGRVRPGAGARQAGEERLLGLGGHHTWTPRCYNHSVITVVQYSTMVYHSTTTLLLTGDYSLFCLVGRCTVSVLE